MHTKKQTAALNKKIMKIILAGRKNGQTWLDISKQVKGKYGIYISSAALQQRHQYHRAKQAKEVGAHLRSGKISVTPASRKIASDIRKLGKMAEKSWAGKTPVAVTIETYGNKMDGLALDQQKLVDEKVTEKQAKLKESMQKAIDSLVSRIDSSTKHFIDNIKEELREALTERA